MQPSHTLEDFLVFVEMKYSAVLLDSFADLLTPGDLGKLLLEYWSGGEFPHVVGTDRLIRLFSKAQGHLIDPAVFNALPDTLKVYRGIKGRSGAKGLSWTTDMKKAAWFANRFGKGWVYEAEIDKKDIFMVVNDREESEVVLNPHGLKNIRVSQSSFRGRFTG